ncbi:MAG: site-specific integrase, partial [Saprospiraceae bacterium]|nr:site-specific integrase [Saprospiraceae bacterium]
PAVQNVTRLNNLIKKRHSDAVEKVIQLEDSGEINVLSMKDIKNRITGKRDETFILEFTNSIIEELEEGGKVGNARVYKTMRNSVHTFLKRKDIPIKQITFKWLKKYEAWYLGRGNSANGLGVNMRTLRAVINRAIKQKLVSREDYAFEHYQVKKEKTRKRAVAATDIEKIKSFVPQTKQQKRAKDYFMMSFYLMGASFIDLAFLKVENINAGRIEYKRRKTGKLHSIKITEPLQEIVDKYLKGKRKGDFILNVIKSEDVKKQYVNVRDELRRYNRRLKEIGELCGLESELTSYVARHSFATIAKFKDVPVSVISQALGHTNLETTETYLAEFDNAVLDDYNELIINQ